MESLRLKPVDAMVVRILSVASILTVLVLSGCTSLSTSEQDKEDSKSNANDPLSIEFTVASSTSAPGGTLTVSRIGTTVTYEELSFMGPAECALGTGQVHVGDSLTCAANGYVNLLHLASSTIVWQGEVQGAESSAESTQSQTTSTEPTPTPTPSEENATTEPGCLKTYSLHGTIVAHDPDKKTYDMRNDVAGPHQDKMMRIYWDSASSPHKQNSSGCMTASNSLFVEPHESFLDEWRTGSPQPGHDYTGIDLIVYAVSHAVYRVDEPYS